MEIRAGILRRKRNGWIGSRSKQPDNKSGKIRNGLPARQGLYDPANEHDACGIGFVANIKNVKSHDIIHDGLTILENLEHRGAVGADPKAGDGVGMLIQMPDAFFRKVTTDSFTLPEEGHYGVGMVFLPPHKGARADIENIINEKISAEGHAVWAGAMCRLIIPTSAIRLCRPSRLIKQIFIDNGKGGDQQFLNATCSLFVV